MVARCLLVLIYLTLLRCVFPAAPPGDAGEEKMDYAAAFPPAPLRLPSLFSDGAVLQRDKPILVWGWGQADHVVSIQIADALATTTVSYLNFWSLELPPQPAGGPHVLTVADTYTTLSRNNFLIGDVWLCAGQSNMTQTLAGASRADEDIPQADHPHIRLFQVPRVMALTAQADYPHGAKWEACTPETARRFSALAYYFGRDLERELNVPIGLVEASWLNTSIQFWLSEAASSYHPDFANWLRWLGRSSTTPGRARLDDQKRLGDWRKHLREEADGSTGTLPWYLPRLRLGREWKRMQMPDIWERGPLGHFDGIVWFRRDFDVPKDLAGRPARLRLNRILDEDTTWLNGALVGSGDDTETTRVYEVPPNVLRAGRNNLTMRIIDTYQWGGITRSTSTLCLEVDGTDGLTTIPLAGEWRVRPGLDLRDAPPRPWESTQQWPRPSGIYNGMLAPLVSYTIRGAVWSQGEAEERQPYRYRYLLEALVHDWRARWKSPEMPFLFTQLSGLGPYTDEVDATPFPVIRDSQQWVADRLDKVAMVPTYDIAGTSEIHYMRKHIAGKRLAAAALAVEYGRSHGHEGPRYKEGSFERLKQGRARIDFNTITPLTVAPTYDPEDLPGFTISGVDRKWYPAKARLVNGTSVEVWSEKVKTPAAIRFGWSAHPHPCLYNQAGLPAHPFRTDRWKPDSE